MAATGIKQGGLLSLMRLAAPFEFQIGTLNVAVRYFEDLFEHSFFFFFFFFFF